MYCEILKIVRRKEYFIIATLLLVSVLLDFYFTCSEYKDCVLSKVPSAYQMTVLSDKDNIFHIFFGSFLFFVIPNLLAVPLLAEEKDCRICHFTFTRTKAMTYIKKQIFAIAFVSFITVWISLMISLLLSISAFPLQGYFTEVTAHNRLMNPDPNRLFSYLYRYYPYINIIVLITLRAVIASVNAFLSCALLITNRLPGFVCMMAPMIIFVIYSVITEAITLHISDVRWFSIVGTYMLPMNRAGSEVVIALYFLTEIFIGIWIIKRGMKRDSLVL